MTFVTSVILPEVDAGSSPIQIKKFETDVPTTVQRIGDLNQKIVFDHLSLRGTKSPIDVLVRAPNFKSQAFYGHLSLFL